MTGSRDDRGDADHSRHEQPGGGRAALFAWVATEATSDADRAFATALFEACGSADRITQEAHLDVFTAMTGPVPGFVAYFAEVMAGYAEAKPAARGRRQGSTAVVPRGRADDGDRRPAPAIMCKR